jgi:hypothetical protein
LLCFNFFLFLFYLSSYELLVFVIAYSLANVSVGLNEISPASNAKTAKSGAKEPAAQTPVLTPPQPNIPTAPSNKPADISTPTSTESICNGSILQPSANANGEMSAKESESTTVASSTVDASTSPTTNPDATVQNEFAPIEEQPKDRIDEPVEAVEEELDIDVTEIPNELERKAEALDPDGIQFEFFFCFSSVYSLFILFFFLILFAPR